MISAAFAVLLVVAARFVECGAITPEKQLYNFINSGLTQLLWTNIDDAGLRLVHSDCSQAIARTLNAIEAGEVWSYRSK